MAVSWLPGSTNVSKLGGTSIYPPISFAPKPGPAPATNVPTAIPGVPPVSTSPTAYNPMDVLKKAGSGNINPLNPASVPNPSSILNPYGNVPGIPGVSVTPGAQPPVTAAKPPATPAPAIPGVPPVSTAPKVDPISGLPIMPPGTKPTTVTSNVPVTTGTETTKPAAIPYNPPIPSGSTTLDPVSGLPVQPAGTKPTTVSSNVPVTTGTDVPKDPVSGLPIQPAGTKPTTVSSNVPVPAGPNTTVANPNNTTPDVSTTPPPPSAFETTLTKYMDILSKWAEGMPDQQYKNALNQIITSSGLMNSAERDALQMQINQDPNLRGQGAGLAMMQVLARDHNFNLDQALAKASGDSLDRIINLQKYGIEQGTRIITDLRDAKLEDAKIALENAQTARDNARQDINTLSSSGQFDAAAAAMNDYMKTAFPGLNLNITAASLKSRDPQELTKMTQKLNFIKDLAGKNPAAALPLIQSMMADPAYDGYFPAGMTAEQVASALTTGLVSENITQANTVNTQINSFALPGVNGKTNSYDETGNLYPELFRLQGRNAVTEGKKLDVADINTIRAQEGLPAFSKDSAGNLVDENGVPLDDADYTELAYRKDFYDKQQAAKTKPWEQMRNQILDSPMGKYFTNEALYPGANDSLNKFLMAYSLSAGAFTTSQDGTITPDWSKLNLSLNSPEMWPIFHNWPTAVFADDGTVTKDAAGNPISTPGGYVYGEIGPDGKPVLSTAADQSLDSNYFAYRNSAGANALDPNQWYYATAGGKNPPDPTKIPAGMKTGENGTQVGKTIVSDIPIPGVVYDTPKDPGSTGADYQAFDDLISKTNGLSADESATLSKTAKDMANAYKNAPVGVMMPLEVGIGGDFDHAYSRLQSLGVKNLDSIAQGTAANPGLFGLGVVDAKAKSYKGTPEFANYSIYVKMLDSGMSVLEARNALSTLIGADRAQAALNLEPENKASSDVSAAINKVR